jgi:cellulose biosynthesis protein BcsQ
MSLHSYTLWAEGGGPGKTTLAASLSKAHERADRDVLLFDFDGQKGSITHWFDLLDKTETDNGDSIVEFLCDAAQSDFDDLIQTVEGIDIVPGGGHWRNVDDAINYYTDDSPDFGGTAAGGESDSGVNKATLFRQLIRREELYEDYDVLVVDAPKDIETPTVNALCGTQNVVIPFPVTPKSNINLDGLLENLISLERANDLNIGIVGVVPNKARKDERVYKKQFKLLEERLATYNEEYDRPVPISPISIGNRGALFEGAWSEQVTPFKFNEDQVGIRNRERTRDTQTLRDIIQLEKWILYRISNGEIDEVADDHRELRIPTAGGESYIDQ